jgi:hypothetical protein
VRSFYGWLRGHTLVVDSVLALLLILLGVSVGGGLREVGVVEGVLFVVAMSRPWRCPPGARARRAYPGRGGGRTRDDGGGAGAAGTGRDPDGLGHGLIGMRERADMHGGTIAAGSRPGGGWRVTATLPLAPGGGAMGAAGAAGAGAGAEAAAHAEPGAA